MNLIFAQLYIEDLLRKSNKVSVQEPFTLVLTAGESHELNSTDSIYILLEKPQNIEITDDRQRYLHPYNAAQNKENSYTFSNKVKIKNNSSAIQTVDFLRIVKK